MDWPRDDTPLHVRTVRVQGASVPTLITTVGSWLFGWVITEPTGTDPASLDLLDGPDDNGQLVAQINLPAGGMSIVHPGVPGIPLPSGLFVQITTGQVTAVFTLGTFT